MLRNYIFLLYGVMKICKRCLLHVSSLRWEYNAITVVVMGVKLCIKQPCFSSLSQTVSIEYGIFISEDRKTNEVVLEGDRVQNGGSDFRRADDGIQDQTVTPGHGV